MAGILRKIDGSLPGGVRPANNVHILIAASHGLGDRGAIIDATAGQGIYARHIQSAVRDAAGYQEGVAAQCRTWGISSTITMAGFTMYYFQSGQAIPVHTSCGDVN